MKPEILVRSLIGPDKLKCGDCASLSESLKKPGGDLSERLLAAVNRAHQDVQDLKDKASGATCTLVLAAWTEGEPTFRYLGIGDSRLYRITPAGIEQLTEDDSVRVPLSIAGEVVMSGGAVKFSSGLTRALGFGILGEVKLHEAPLDNGDLLLAVTDGFHELSGFQTRLADVYDAVHLERAFASQLEAYHAVAGRDDATAVLLRRGEADARLAEACRGLVASGRAPAASDPPRHLLVTGVSDLMRTAAGEGDYAILDAAAVYVDAQALIPARDVLAGVLDAFEDDGSAEARTCYRKVSAILQRAV